MPQANRDQERLYPPGRLSVWFLFASVALVVSLGWMIWADHFQRPWKAIQADYYRRQAGLLEIDRQRKEATVLGVGARDDEERAAREKVAALEARVAAADRRLDARRNLAPWITEHRRVQRHVLSHGQLRAETEPQLQ